MPASLGVHRNDQITVDDACRLQRHRLVNRDLVVAVHGAARAEIAQEVYEVVGKTVVVIDQQKHGTTPSAGGSKYRR